MATQRTTDLMTPTGPVPVPSLGFGTWQVPDAETDAAVGEALRVGYRHIDTAAAYRNEAGVGRALAASEVHRNDVTVTTKVWPSMFGATETPRSVTRSLDLLGLEVLDLVLLHWPAPAQDRYVDAWRALQALRDEGRVLVIGVCNFHAPHLQRLFDETGEWPAINQVELHPYLQQRELSTVNADHGIVTEAWSPLASGKKVLADPVIGEIAAAHDATPAKVIIAWHLEQGRVVLPKSVTPSRIAENFAAAQLRLTEADLVAIAELDRGFRTGPDPDHFHG